MRRTNNGAGNVLPTAGQNNQKRGPAKQLSSKQPADGTSRPLTNSVQEPTVYPVPLSDPAAASIATLCRRYRVKPECVMQSIVESYLIDACADDTLAPTVANEAREIERMGKVPSEWWPEDASISTPGFENESPEGEEGSALKRQPSSKDNSAGEGRVAGENAGVVLRLEPAAHGLLVAMAAYREDANLETSIMAQLAENVEAWAGAVSSQGAVQELFLSGEVLVKKEEQP